MSDRVDELLAQLEALSPLPDDGSVCEDVLDAYAKIIAELSQFKDLRMIQPLIASLGYGTGFGLNWSVVDLLEDFAPEQVTPHLVSALQHGARGSRMWAASMLGWSRDRTAIPHLIDRLNDPEELVRAYAVLALGTIGDPSSREHVERLADDPSPDVRHAAKVALTHSEK